MTTSTTDPLKPGTAETWLDRLQVGDTVIVYLGGYGSSSRAVSTITKAGKIHVEVQGAKFRRSDAHEVGEWTRKVLQEATPEAVRAVREEKRRRELVTNLRGVKWDSLSTDVLAAAWSAVEGNGKGQERKQGK